MVGATGSDCHNMASSSATRTWVVVRTSKGRAEHVSLAPVTRIAGSLSNLLSLAPAVDACRVGVERGTLVCGCGKPTRLRHPTRNSDLDNSIVHDAIFADNPVTASK